MRAFALHLHFGAERPKTAKTFDEKGLVVLCSSFSKTLAPGYRIGWTIPGRFKEKVLRLKRMHTVSTNTLSQAAVADFLSNGLDLLGYSVSELEAEAF